MFYPQNGDRNVTIDSMTMQLAQHRFHGLAISNAEIWIYFFQINIRKQFYQTALGSCYGSKLSNCWLQFKEENSSCQFVIIFGTLSFPVLTCDDYDAGRVT